MIKTVLFDLDGTLLPMDQDDFINAYFKYLAEKLLPYGYEPQKLMGCIWKGTEAMVRNDGSCTNEEAFWSTFARIYGEGAREDEPVFDAFYRNEFNKVAEVCGYQPMASQIIGELKAGGYRVALATNPIFPQVATFSRIRWAGLKPEDFEWITTYENSCYCKPEPRYYIEVTEKLGCKPDECLMIGNDVTEDMVAETVGMRVFLLTDCLINKEEKELSLYPHGGFGVLEDYLSRQMGHNAADAKKQG